MEKRDDLVQEQSEVLEETQESIEIHEHRTLEESSEPTGEMMAQKPHDLSSDELIDEARAMVNESDTIVRDCANILDDDINAYNSKKEKLLNGNAKRVEFLLDEVGFEPEEMQDVGIDAEKFGGENMVHPMYVKSLSAGKFSSLFLALIFGFASVVVWIYVATEKLGMTLDISKIPTPQIETQIFSWIGGGITGGEGNPLYGMVIVGLTAIIVMWGVYASRVAMRRHKNLKVAQRVSEDAKLYCTKKEDCKREMERVSEHIHKVINTLDTYDVLLEEQSAKIKRIVHIEGKLPFHEYNQKSKDDMNDIGRLTDSLNRLISTPMADEMNGSLSMESREALAEAGNAQKIFIEKLYL